MANKSVRLLLNAAEFPFTYAQFGRSVLENADLNARMPGVFFGSAASAEFGVPQLIYCENVLPTAKGIFAVGYEEQVASIGAITTADQQIALRDIDENQYTFVPAGGANYVYNPATSTWASVNPFTFTGSLVTVAYVNGRTFICYENDRIIEYVAGTFATISLTLPAGLLATDIRGISNASNYLILFTTIGIYWCSPLNILDFANSDQGAGQQIPTDILGQITAIESVTGGFIIYTTRNAVAAMYTNNGNAPFVFKGIDNCGGVASRERITTKADFPGHYVWSTGGLQKVTLQGAEPIHPAITDFLVGYQAEVWNASTKNVDISTIGGAYSVKLAFLVDRYLIISYGYGSLTFSGAFVLDTVLNRWGKLRIPHVDAFTYTYPIASGNMDYAELPGFYSDLGELTYSDLGRLLLSVPAAKRGIAFMDNTGKIMVLSTDFTQTTADGVAVFGHIAQRHGDVVTALSAELEGAFTPDVTLLGSTTGADRDIVYPMGLVSTAGKHAEYHSYVTAKNFDLVVEGAFVLSTAMMGVKNGGSR